MKSIFSLIISGALLVSGLAQTRNVLVGTNNAVVQPTNFWSADASNARTGLGLGTAATNPASAFQPSSTVLSNIASSNAANLTNLRATNLVGIIPSSNIPTVSLTNISGTLAISSGGTGATNAGVARTNLGLGATNEVALGGIILRDGDAIKSEAAGDGDLLVGAVNTVFGGAVGFNNTTNAATTRANLGFSTNLNTLWTATNASNARSAVGLDATNSVTFQRITVDPSANAAAFRFGTNFTGLWAGPDDNYGSFFVRAGGSSLVFFETNRILFFTNVVFDGGSSGVVAAQSRTNLGLGWPALTNSNAGTGLVSVNTSGEVVSPTNFWQVAPINTRVQLSQPVVNATNAATNARNLYLYSLSISTTGVTNTITLQTNSLVFLGDVATVIHDGPTSSVTAIRQIGSATNLITLNQVREAVKFIYESDGWRLADNISYVEPIQFSGTNAAANAAASRTNLGLGWPALTNTNAATSLLGFTTNGQVVANTGTNVLTFTNSVSFKDGSNVDFSTIEEGRKIAYIGESRISLDEMNFAPRVAVFDNIDSPTNILVISPIAATTRTNLGLPLAALTNTNNATFQEAIFTTNSAPTNGGTFGDHVAWMGVSIVTNGVTNTFKIPLYK